MTNPLDATIPSVAFEGISKTYPNGTVALSDVTFDIPAGTIHAICGENGAGKSTLMKVLFGLLQPTSGQVLIEGRPVRDHADTKRIGMVHQHFSLIPTLTVAENVILGQEPRIGPFIARRAAHQMVSDLVERFGLQVAPNALVRDLSVAAQQKVEILKALARDTRILILDEPTAVLSPPEIEELFRRLHAFQAAGMTILFISHKLGEVRALAEQVSVLRSGRYVGTELLANVPDDRIMQMVMGAAVDVPIRKSRPLGDVVLDVRQVSIRPDDRVAPVDQISFAIRAGEIVGVAGVDGSGQQGLVEVLSGARQVSSGSITLNGQDLATANVATWRKSGLAHLPADRFSKGGAPAMSVAVNAVAGHPLAKDLRRGKFLRPKAMAQKARDLVRAYSVRCLGVDEPLDSLSGGNAQKVIAARELGTAPKFLIADQPTRGIDVASAAFLHRRISDLADNGGAILLVTADLDELLRLSDRILVMFGGRVTAEIPNTTKVTPAMLGPFMLGLEEHR